jgi:hypothetical protein
MIIEQTIEIPASRRLTIDVPPEVPEGRVVISFTPAETLPSMSRQMKKMMKYYGCLRDSPAFEGDSVEIIRALRDEWDEDAGVQA